MDIRILYIIFLLKLQIWFPPVRTIVTYTLGSSCSFPLGSECPDFPHSVCNSGKCECRQPDYESSVDFPHVCERRASCGSSCLSGHTRAECYVGLSCVNINTLGQVCVCPSGQFGYQKHTKMCRSVTTLRADNLHLNEPHNETELSLEWDRPLNVSDPLTYRMVINGIENITSISMNMYKLTNRQPGTPYRIQIYTSTIEHCGIIEEKIENDNPLQGTFCTKPAIPGSLTTNIYSNSSVTLQFFRSDGRVESYSVTVTANTSRDSQNQSITSGDVVDWRNTTFYNLIPGELYDVRIKAFSCGLESEGRIDYFIIQPSIPGSLATNSFSTPNVTLQFSESEGRVESYSVTIIANSSGQSVTQLFTSNASTGVWRNVTFYNLEAGEFYDVKIKAISWGVESEDRLDYFVIRAPYEWSCLSVRTPDECPIGQSCVYIQAKSGNVCVCPSGQFGYQSISEICENAYSEEPSHENQVVSTGAIVGGVVGGLCFVVIVAIVICLLVQRHG